jgi:nucleoside-diphosphate-sugar epimerase
MRVLVTGGTGYVGTVLVPLLAKRYPVRVFCAMNFGNAIAGTPNVEFVKGDIRDEQAVGAALKDCEAVVHLAGIVTDELCAMNPDLARQVNVEGMSGLVRLARESGVRRFVYASSSGVYGSQKDGEIADETSPTKPETVYMETKLAGEAILAHHRTPNFETVSVRSATCCGPAPRMRLDTIVNTFSKQAYFDKRITVWGGGQWRTNVHVQDAAALYERVLEASARETDGEVFNCTHSNMTARGIAEQVASAIHAEVIIDTSKVDSRDYRMSARKAQRKLGWYPFLTIDRAIIDNRDWFAAGGVPDPNSDLWYNTRRMQSIMKEPAA